jgi:hypothetical protein
MIDDHTEQLLRLFTKKNKELKIIPDKMVDKTHDPFESDLLGWKGEYGVCNFFGVPFHWDWTGGELRDSGKDILVGDKWIEAKTSWHPRNNTHVLLPIDKDRIITADYVVQVCTENDKLIIHGWVSKEEFFKRAIPLDKFPNRPLGIHCLTMHPISQLLVFLNARKILFPTDPQRIERSEKFKAELEKELLSKKDLQDIFNSPYYQRIKSMTWGEFSADLVRRQREELLPNDSQS